MTRPLSRAVAYLWAGPVSVIALPIAVAAVASGGRARAVDGVLEARGGVLGMLLTRTVRSFPVGAITLGHVVLAADERSLAACREHERVHVRQYERWGILFPVLYAASSVRALLAGGYAYRDNAFEKQARRLSGEAWAA